MSEHVAGRLEVLPFGSFVSGLGTSSSDVDVVVVGVKQPRSGGFYDKGERCAWLPHVVGRGVCALSCL